MSTGCESENAGDSFGAWTTPEEAENGSDSFEYNDQMSASPKVITSD